MIEIFLDVETTGLSYRDGDKIVEIACIETEDLIPTGNNFHEILNPDRSVSEDAFKVHGFSDNFLKNKKKFSEISMAFQSFIKDKNLIIHNAKFDIGFLNNELREVRQKEININKVTDSLEVARNKFPGTSNSLDSLCRRYNIDLSRRTKHNALLDCELLREVYINLIGVKEPKFSFASNNTEKINTKNSYSVGNHSKKIVIVDEKEVSNHKEFLKKDLKKNYY
ncbi:MAG: DNA polymerase III subunit epsilon [Pelagibacteraceae bacterium TMED216]|nr:MAG: DNA polymerase III subunit epsilon [Pelagibacteraceae bacterium TMED216]|tara:strand:- start:4511 stop:5182 length:672 start_codon:yes stop_codon:yes gene_type:complete